MTYSGNTHSPMRLRGNSLRKKLDSQSFVIGTFLEIPSPALIELLGLAGFDFVVIDCEHGPIDLRSTENLIRASTSTAISVVVRPPEGYSPTASSQPLDWGAAGIQVPQVTSAETAERIVRSSKYYPLGMRGLQPYVRAASYRCYPTQEYLTEANDDSVLIAQVEGIEGIGNLEQILKVNGLDIAFVGPYDLSQSLGIPAQVKHPRVQEALVATTKLARNLGKCIGTYADDIETAASYLSMGISYLTVSIDAHIFFSSARSMISELKRFSAAIL